MTSCAILDGAAIVQILKPEAAKNFADYAANIFILYVDSQLHNVSRVDFVWDVYVEDSLKNATREKCGKGVRSRVVPGAVIPSNW